MDFQTRIDAYKDMVEAYLRDAAAVRELPQKVIFEAMGYSLLAGGKRLRPVLMLEFTRICGGDVRAALPFAAALEMIHTYSLIHDDLPCMDDDDMRRGRPTSHIVFGEANAVLAGDGLLTLAFETMLDPEKNRDLPPERRLAAAYEIAAAAGAFGMIGGQTVDLQMEKTTPDVEEVSAMYAMKTGALIRAACVCGCILAGAPKEHINAAKKYALALGLAFQIRDDLLDETGDPAKMGKAVGRDKKQNKPSLARLLGADQCRYIIHRQTSYARSAIQAFHDREFLESLADGLANRES